MDGSNTTLSIIYSKIEYTTYMTTLLSSSRASSPQCMVAAGAGLPDFRLVTTLKFFSAAPIHALLLFAGTLAIYLSSESSFSFFPLDFHYRKASSFALARVRFLYRFSLRSLRETKERRKRGKEKFTQHITARGAYI